MQVDPGAALHALAGSTHTLDPALPVRQILGCLWFDTDVITSVLVSYYIAILLG